MRGIFIVNSVSDSKTFTLPVFVTAAAKAALEILNGHPFRSRQTVDLLEGQESINVLVESAALIGKAQGAIGICHSSAVNKTFDITSGLEIWTFVKWKEESIEIIQDKELETDSWLEIHAGFGVGKYEENGRPCISTFAFDLINRNLRPLVPKGRSLFLEIVFPDGVDLAKRTSNEAFGVVEGLSIIGTQAETQLSASPQQLQKSLENLRLKCSSDSFEGCLVFVIGENGLDLALQLGFPADLILKTGNWLGPLLVEAARSNVQNLFILGYHGKLVKLAGGVFHTHHHLADARLEILTSLAVREGLPLEVIRTIGTASSVQAALLSIESVSASLAKQLWFKLAYAVEERSTDYIGRYGTWSMKIGAALFDSERRLRWAGPLGSQYLESYGVVLTS